MTRDEWNALVARYTYALTTRVNTHDPALLPARDLAVADALLAVLEGERRLREAGRGTCLNCATEPCTDLENLRDCEDWTRQP